ncbi:hypothetical protein [Corallococcus llansteffanensis]|uniref:Uncharacterized protein n=1 Tax=Corallococcus llansteffanensis TaxID=2316731 RepID=A0A3A8QLL2_9BACT|nr:hypothetical protein [Corallococcus llansteffanensis]RKH64074.1 hypothetical protein D7V93_07945 [Corallococcus llansteffanensis]
MGRIQPATGGVGASPGTDWIASRGHPMMPAMDATDIGIVIALVALGLGRFLLMRDQRRAPSAGASPQKPTRMRFTARVLLGFAYVMVLAMVVRLLIHRM